MIILHTKLNVFQIHNNTMPLPHITSASFTTSYIEETM